MSYKVGDTVVSKATYYRCKKLGTVPRGYYRKELKVLEDSYSPEDLYEMARFIVRCLNSWIEKRRDMEDKDFLQELVLLGLRLPKIRPLVLKAMRQRVRDLTVRKTIPERLKD